MTILSWTTFLGEGSESKLTRPSAPSNGDVGNPAAVCYIYFAVSYYDKIIFTHLNRSVGLLKITYRKAI